MLVLDAGAFIALERNERAMWRRLKATLIEGEPPMTHGGVVGQVWRGGTGRQVQIARTLQAVDAVPLDLHLGQQAGVLLAGANASDAIDAALVALVRNGDRIATSDPNDIAELVAAAGVLVDVIAV